MNEKSVNEFTSSVEYMVSETLKSRFDKEWNEKQLHNILITIADYIKSMRKVNLSLECLNENDLLSDNTYRKYEKIIIKSIITCNKKVEVLQESERNIVYKNALL